MKQTRNVKGADLGSGITNSGKGMAVGDEQ
jgi:hypothetical protein